MLTIALITISALPIFSYAFVADKTVAWGHYQREQRAIFKSPSRRGSIEEETFSQHDWQSRSLILHRFPWRFMVCIVLPMKRFGRRVGAKRGRTSIRGLDDN